MKFVYLFLAITYIFACNESHDTSDHDHQSESEVHANDHHHLVLNNGEKWQADATTNEAVANMKSTIEKFKNKENKSDNEYQQLGQELQQHYADLVKKCTMKGPEHDQLHVFLELLQPKIKNLKETGNRSEGEKLVAETEALVSDYYDYFK